MLTDIYISVLLLFCLIKKFVYLIFLNAFIMFLLCKYLVIPMLYNKYYVTNMLFSKM